MLTNQLIPSDNEYLEQAKKLSFGLSLPREIENGSKYTNDIRITVVTLYVMLGRLMKVSELVGISRFTLHEWRKTEWWAELVTKLRTSKSDQLDSRINNLIDKALDNIENRFISGEYATYDRDTGQTIYKPVSAKDNAMIFGILFDKQRVNRALPTSFTQHTHAHLLDIKQQFENMTQTKTIEGDVIK